MTEQNHYEFNQFYSFGEHLIICFFRGKNYENDKKIDVEEKLEFPRNEKPVPMPEKENAYNKYYLVGSVNRVINKGKDEFYYFARDPKIKNKWYDLYEGNEIFETSRINLIKKTGQVIILFYTAEKINK